MNLTPRGLPVEKEVCACLLFVRLTRHDLIDPSEVSWEENADAPPSDGSFDLLMRASRQASILHRFAACAGVDRLLWKYEVVALCAARKLDLSPLRAREALLYLPIAPNCSSAAIGRKIPVDRSELHSVLIQLTDTLQRISAKQASSSHRQGRTRTCNFREPTQPSHAHVRVDE
jgi:hypothetical protein